MDDLRTYDVLVQRQQLPYLMPAAAAAANAKQVNGHLPVLFGSVRRQRGSRDGGIYTLRRAAGHYSSAARQSIGVKKTCHQVCIANELMIAAPG